MGSAITRDQWKPSPAVRNMNTPDGAVLLDIDQGLCFSMNPVGARIWDLLKMNHAPDFIADTLARECSVPRDQILADLPSFLEQLKAQKLLVSSAESQKGASGLLQRLFGR